MNILMLIDSLFVGGAETHVVLLARELSLMGHKVVIASAGGPLGDNIAQDGIESVVFPPISNRDMQKLNGTRHSLCARNATSIFRWLRARNIIARTIERFSPDVVHAHTRRTALLANSLCKMRKIPLVVTAHAKFSMKFPKLMLSRWGDSTVAVSRDIAIHLLHNGVNNRTLTVVENGVKLQSSLTPRG